MRQATYDEIAQAYSQQRATREWKDVLSFAKQLYGENVYRVMLVTDYTHDDDGDEQHYLVGLEAYDKQERKLAYDFTLPFWQQTYYTGKTYNDHIAESIGHAVVREREKRDAKTIEELLEQTVRALIHDDLPELDNLHLRDDYYADATPVRSMPITLYIDHDLH